MPIKILLPALSPTMTTGNLTKWHKKKGDFVKSGELLAEVETDKATMEIEAVDEGKLAEILIPEQTMDVPVNSVIAVLLEDGEDESVLAAFINKQDASIQKQEKQEQSIAQEPAAMLASFATEPEDSRALSDSKIFASPLAKRIASQMSVDLSSIQGSGPNGRIIKVDVLKAAEAPKAIFKQEALPAAGAYSLQPHTGMRKIIASRLLESKQTIPHFYLSIDCRIDGLIALREQINKDAEVKISINDFVIKAVALSLKQLPDVNSSWSNEGIKKYSNVDISVAVSVDNGLVTPIINNADYKSLSSISGQMKDLAARARENKLKPEEYQGGNFTISNLGMFGVKNFCAIINPPQACILAIGATEKKPVVIGDKIEIASIMNVTLSCDHRVVDGLVGANFLKVFKGYLENPVKMLI
jgi:pyruvate dehydrogenase E2 component (dihydrolipoamide acetyltransferase)